MVMGEYGTLVWMDSESETPYFDAQKQVQAQRSPAWSVRVSNLHSYSETDDSAVSYTDGTGERIAGHWLPLDVPQADPLARSRDDGSSAAQQTNGEGSTTSFALALQGRATGPLLPVDAADAATMRKPSAQTTSLFARRPREGWSALATNERAARVAVGDSEGFVEVWDYF